VWCTNPSPLSRVKLHPASFANLNMVERNNHG
jgi:hypothetical protein